jgi:diguanylate cyclase
MAWGLQCAFRKASFTLACERYVMNDFSQSGLLKTGIVAGPETRLFGMSMRGWRMVAGWTLAGTAGCIAFSVAFNALVFFDLEMKIFLRAIAVAVVLPVLLAGPLFFYLTMKMRELARANHQLNELATRDPGTGLLNRRALISRVNEESAKMAFNPRITHLFVVVDADRFKLINDRFGHSSGDEALALIAGALQKSVRHYDVVGRIGGEEFALSLPNVSIDDAIYISERLRRSVTSLQFRPRGQRHDLSVSIGGVIYNEPTAFSDLFKAADGNLYAAKAEGRNCCIITHYGDHAPTRAEIEMLEASEDKVMRRANAPAGLTPAAPAGA